MPSDKKTSKKSAPVMSEQGVSVSPSNGSEDGFVGELTVGEMRLIQTLRQNADALVREIGNLEVRKAQLLNQLNQIEQQGQSVLNGAAKRLNIPNGETWQVMPDGKVRRTGPAAGTPAMG